MRKIIFPAYGIIVSDDLEYSGRFLFLLLIYLFIVFITTVYLEGENVREVLVKLSFLSRIRR